VLEASRGAEGPGATRAEDVALWRVLVDWRIHLLSLVFFCADVTAASVSAFSPTILTELGWQSRQAQVMTMPIWVAGIAATFAVTGLATRLDLRWPFMLACVAAQLAGWAVMRAYVPAASVRYAALFLMSAGTFPQFAMSLGWLSANLRGRKYLAVGMAWVSGARVVPLERNSLLPSTGASLVPRD